MPKLKAVLFNDTAQSGHHGCTLVIRQIRSLATKYDIEIDEQYSSLVKLDARHGQKTDLLLINGEGSLHHSSKSALSIAHAIDWAKAQNIPSYLVNTIYQDNDSQIGASVASADRVYLRDKKSEHVLHEMGINAHYVPDLSLSWNAGPTEVERSSSAITDSTLKETNRIAFLWAQNNPGARYLPLLAAPSNGNAGFFGNFARRSKFFFKRTILAHFSSPFYRARYRNAVPVFDEFVDLFTKQNLIIAGRFHAICLAIDLGIPFCAVASNSWKVETLLQEAGVPDRLISENELIQTGLAELEQRFGQFSPHELNGLKQLKQKAADGADQMFREIAKSAAAFKTTGTDSS